MLWELAWWGWEHENEVMYSIFLLRVPLVKRSKGCGRTIAHVHRVGIWGTVSPETTCPFTGTCTYIHTWHTTTMHAYICAHTSHMHHACTHKYRILENMPMGNEVAPQRGGGCISHPPPRVVIFLSKICSPQLLLLYLCTVILQCLFCHALITANGVCLHLLHSAASSVLLA